tara:strand:- start:156 stop:281 length:126 start_codon:yes stop_codon:yes gene_type:complete
LPFYYHLLEECKGRLFIQKTKVEASLEVKKWALSKELEVFT